MPGLRLGYGLCADGGLLERMTACGQPWSVSVPAQAAGLQALKEQDYVQRTRALVRESGLSLRRDCGNCRWRFMKGRPILSFSAPRG